MSTLSIHLKSIRCHEDTSEHDSDEPYVLVFAASLRDLAGMVRIPSAKTVLYGPWGDMDDGDRGVTGVPSPLPGVLPALDPVKFWGLDGKPAAVGDDTLFLVALMENDNGKPDGIRAALHAQLFASLTSYANSGMTRDIMVRQLLQDMRDCLSGPIAMGVLNNDDLIGVAELRIAPDSSGVSSLRMEGDGGEYELFFQVERHASTLKKTIVHKPVTRKVSAHILKHRVD